MAKQEKNQQAQTEHSQAGAVIEMLTERVSWEPGDQ